jgi:hypothetical protein
VANKKRNERKKERKALLCIANAHKSTRVFFSLFCDCVFFSSFLSFFFFFSGVVCQKKKHHHQKKKSEGEKKENGTPAKE